MAAKTLARTAAAKSSKTAKAAPAAKVSTAKARVNTAAAKEVAAKEIAKATTAAKKTVNAKTAKAKDAETRSYYAPEDALVIPTTGNSRLIVMATEFTNDKGDTFNNVAFMKGYEKDGNVLMTGKSGSIPQALLAGAKGKKIIAMISEYLMLFN